MRSLLAAAVTAALFVLAAPLPAQPTSPDPSRTGSRSDIITQQSVFAGEDVLAAQRAWSDTLYVGREARAGVDSVVEVFSDFTERVFDTNLWFALDGSDPQATQAIEAGLLNGALTVTSGDVSTGTVATGGSGIARGLLWEASSAGDTSPLQLIYRTRIRLPAVTTMSVNLGFTDTTSLEEPFTMSGATVSAVATDAVCFLYDTAATTDAWYAVAVNEGTLASAETGVAPAAGEWAEFEIVLNSDADAVYLIDGEEVATIASACSPEANLTPLAIVCNTTTTTRSMNIDTIYAGGPRAE